MGLSVTNKELVELVKDFPAWGGNTFTLANLILQRQREDDAQIAESLNQQEVADAIRAAA